jgi:hypothetical protein
MTDLQLGLLVIGAAAVAAVLIYNRLQERAARRDTERAFASRHADVLSDPDPARREPTLEPLPRQPGDPAERHPDPRADYVIRLSGVAPAALRPEWSALEHRFAGKAMLFESGDGLQATLQMVSRSGVIGEAELLEFRSRVETLAAAHGAAASAPEMREALEAANELDRDCAEVDIQIALHVLGASRSPQEDAAFRIAPRPDGGVTFLLDVPRTSDLPRSYESMVRSARQLGGRLVDDNGNALDERALAAIGTELEATCGRFAALGIEPGSPLALRLFS